MQNLPRVLVVGINAWIDNTGINTLINLFNTWDKDSLAHLYTTDALPKTKVCDRFFRISEAKVVKSILNRQIKTGSEVYNSDFEIKKDQRIKRKHNIFLTWAREAVWKFGKWKTKELNNFIDDYNADVLFMPLYSSIYINRLQNYIAKRTGKPVVIYASDDNYTYKSCSKNPLSLLHRFFLRRQIKRLVKKSKNFIVIAPKQKEEYDKIFKCDCEIITKGIDYQNLKFVPYTVHDPIKMVYTGKLIIGRGNTLQNIVDALGEINVDGLKIKLDIYTTDILTNKQKKLLNRNGSLLCGSLPQNEVERVQTEADILLFVEGLQKRYRNRARLSFSTKITDYLKKGKCIFAVGDTSIAPIDYFIKNDAAIVVSDKKEIYNKLLALIDDGKLIRKYSKKAFECGKKNHEINVQNKLLINSIKGAING